MTAFVITFRWKLKVRPLPKYFGSGHTVIGVDAENLPAAKAHAKARFPDRSIRFTNITEFRNP